jgi:hypothetical protein
MAVCVLSAPTLMMMGPRPFASRQDFSASSMRSWVDSRSISETIAMTIPLTPQSKSQSISRSNVA